MWEIKCGDALEVLKTMPDGIIQTCVTSPPYYGLRDYGHEEQIGGEPTPEEYVNNLVLVFREVRRVLRDDGTLWLNLGDSYCGSMSGAVDDSKIKGRNIGKPRPTERIEGLKPKDLIGIPWRVAFALQADGWYLRSDIIWAKGNPMPESVKDRPTKSHEYLFLLSKNPKYFYDSEAIKEPAVSTDNSFRDRDLSKLNNTPGRTRMGGLKTNHYATRNKRSVWNINTRPYPGAHFAVFPPDLVEPCILAGTSPQACEICGTPWERIIQQGELKLPREPREYLVGVIPGRDKPSRVQSKHMETIPKETIGWQSACACENTGRERCIVLDPFCGSGTTLQVAFENNRKSIGIELNPEYINLIEQRMEDRIPKLF